MTAPGKVSTLQVGLPSPARALRDALAMARARGVGPLQAALLLLTWPNALLLAWVLVHPDGQRLVDHGLRLGMDGHAYWSMWRTGLYTLPPRALDAYLYSPAFAQVLRPLTLLPLALFVVIWWGAITSAFCWLLAPLPWIWRGPALIVCGFELQVGNVHAFIAVMLVLGHRRPAVWTLALLTKITPGVGLLWFAVRGEWRQLGRAVGATALVATVSAVISPQLWVAWFGFLVRQAHGGPGEAGLLDARTLPVRLLLAGLLVAWGARTDRPYVLAPAVALASPLVGLATLTILAALPRLVLEGREAAARGARDPQLRR